MMPSRSCQIAYIAERPAEPDRTNQDPIFYSCFIDGACQPDHRGRRKPKFTVRLPGHPILGNGKSDNQNHAIIFSRGSVIQAIDANQDGYVEESLKLCCALREFEKQPGGPEPPAVVGFREHIFSGMGALGAFGAASEMVFGGLAQRTMAEVLHSRYHYGHPDLMSKCKMSTQTPQVGTVWPPLTTPAPHADPSTTRR